MTKEIQSRLLVVEDSPTQAENLRLVLEDIGFAVEVARDAEEALASFVQQPSDAIISDIVMPGLSGYELCRRIKDMPGGRRVPIILLTTLSDPMDIVQGLESGADSFLTKPYEPNQLVARARSLLDNRNARADDKFRMGVELVFMGKRFSITSEKEQMLNLLISTFEDTLLKNQELRASQAESAAAKAKLEEYAALLEGHAEASEEKYRRLVEAANDAILLADAEKGIIIDVNRAAGRLFGMPPEKLIGLHQKKLHPEGEGQDYEKLFHNLLTSGQAVTADIFIRRADGGRVPVEISGSVFELHGRRVALGIFRDVTERKATEAQLRQSQKMEAVGHLTGGVAHDFNNLLTIVLGNLQLIERSIVHNPESLGRARSAIRAAQRGADLTRRLLAFSRSQILEEDIVRLNDFVAGVSDMLHRTLGEHIMIETHLDPELGLVRIDPGQFETALLNLCVNSRDAMPDHGKLTIETADVFLDEAYASRHSEVTAGPYVMVAVTDTGTGMTPAVVEQAFDPFFTTKDVGKGTGLGLSMVYGFVKQSQGHAKIYSEVGHGTTVKLYFPRVQDEVTTARAVDQPERSDAAARDVAPGGTETILVVEDDADVRDIAVRVLQGLGYRVLTAPDGRSALALLKQSTTPIDLLFTDMVMPGGVTGLDLVQEARRRVPGLRALITSGYTRTAMVRNGTVGETIEMIAKPYDQMTLARKIRSVLDRVEKEN